MFADLFFFRIYLCLSRDFVNRHVFLLLDLHRDSPKLPWGIQRICGPFVLKSILSRDSLSCDTRSLNLCVLFKFIFLLIPLIHSAPFLLFSHILLYTNFFWCNITTRNIFFIPDDPVARNLTIIFNFSSQRPHLNYIFFLTFIVLIQWNFPRNIPTKLQAMLWLVNKSESLKCAKVVFLKLGANLFFCGIHLKPLKLWQKYREDLNRHIPLKINEFASLALAGRYP